MKEQYIGGVKERGLKYDWHKIRKEFRKMGVIPHEYYDPCTAPLESAQWFVEVSERAVGKTTAWLLLGLLMHEMYGTVTVYVRSKRDMIAPKNSSSLYNVILANHYIDKITDGKYNHITYKSRKWYLCNIDKNGDIIDISPDYCTRMIAIEEGADLKSSFNEPFADIMLFDEFIPVNVRACVPNEFVYLVDVCSTVFRLRECCKVVLLANTIDRYNQYFHDLEIFERVATTAVSENFTHTTSGGTKVYFEMIGAPKQYRTKKERWNRLFAGFNKPELSSITGAATWAVKCYQHIPYTDDENGADVETVYTKLYVYSQNKYIRLDVVDNSELGRCIYAHWATRVYPDSIILTTEQIQDSRYIWGIGRDTQIGKYLLRMLEMHKIYFAANDVGAFFENYLIKCGVTSKFLL